MWVFWDWLVAMGQAKLRRSSQAAVLRNAQGCTYCGGVNTAVEIDHMPPRLMFRTMQRPKGLEFPSCKACNRGTSRVDVVAAYMARTLPGISNQLDTDEWNRLLREVERVAPGLLREMHIPSFMQETLLAKYGIQKPDKHAVLRANGPLLSAHMQAFAAKVGFALHYEFTGAIVPIGGRVQIRWFTSEEMVNRRIPESLYSSVGTPQVMKQGQITSADIFEYGYGIYEQRPEISLFFARLRQAVEIAAFVVDDPTQLPFPEGALATFAPGDLQDIPVDRIKD